MRNIYFPCSVCLCDKRKQESGSVHFSYFIKWSWENSSRSPPSKNERWKKMFRFFLLHCSYLKVCPVRKQVWLSSCNALLLEMCSVFYIKNLHKCVECFLCNVKQLLVWCMPICHNIVDVCGIPDLLCAVFFFCWHLTNFPFCTK